MKKFQKVILLITALIFISTFNPKFLINFNNNFINFFKIKNIEIINNRLISDKEIKKKLTYVYEKNIFFIKKEEIQSSLMQFNLIDYIEIKKKFPDKLVVIIQEEKPIAILTKKKKKFFITQSNHLINFYNKAEFKDLPLVIGHEAEKDFVSFFNLLKYKDFPVNLIQSFHFFKIKRWDIYLHNNKIIKLPFENVPEAIDQANFYLKNKDFEKYSILDFRINGKIITQ